MNRPWIAVDVDGVLNVDASAKKRKSLVATARTWLLGLPKEQDVA